MKKPLIAIALLAILAVAVILFASALEEIREQESEIGSFDYKYALRAYKAGDYATTLKVAVPLAEQGVAWAQSAIGHMYYRGEGVKWDDAEAAKWIRKAAEQGFAEAQLTLGNMYGKGAGVPENKAEMMKWYRKAAEQGKDGAQRNLGLEYQYGGVVAKDYAEAAKWYRKAAEQGDTVAQDQLRYIMREMGESE